jgi:2',3'-cyclic-nucleotide 2'-phosphodiesterase
MKILFIGDVFGEPGRAAVKKRLPELRKEKGLDFVVANVENAAHGRGVTPKMIEEFQSWGVDAFTAGNHLWDQKEIIPYLSNSKVLVRPANYRPEAPGRGALTFDVYSGVKVCVISVEGQRLMGNAVDSPFAAVDRELTQVKGKADIILVDCHAETTSEKRAMGWHLDGRVAAVVGTHTHVQTADEEILPNGTAYVTDIGMTGPYNSVIGLDKNASLTRFVKQMPAPFEVGQGDVRLCAVLIDVEESKGRARQITRIQEKLAL